MSIKPELELLRFKLLVDWQAVKLSFKKDRLSKQGHVGFLTSSAPQPLLFLEEMYF